MLGYMLGYMLRIVEIYPMNGMKQKENHRSLLGRQQDGVPMEI